MFEPLCRAMASSRLISGSGGSSIGESSVDPLVVYLGVAASPGELEYWSMRGKVWLRGRWELEFEGTATIGREWGVGIKGEGAVPESGVKNGDVPGLRGPGENEDGAVSVKALFSEVVLWLWNTPCL